MKVTTTALLMAMMAGTALAQSAPPSQTVTPSRKAASAPAKTAMHPAAKPATKPAAKVAAKPAAPKTMAKRSPMEPKTKGERPAAEAVKTAAKVAPVGPSGRRDPFVSPV